MKFFGDLGLDCLGILGVFVGRLLCVSEFSGAKFSLFWVERLWKISLKFVSE